MKGMIIKMCNCRRRRCYCLYNSCQNDDKQSYETLCDNVSNNGSSYNDSCSCGFDEDIDVFPVNPMFAQSYVPFQTMNETYKPCFGLEKGTIFPELVSKYYPGQSMAEIQYIADTNTIGEGCNK